MKMSLQKEHELERIHEFLRQHLDNLPAINQVAMLMHKNGFPLEQALKTYESHLARHPSTAGAAYNYAWYLARDGQFESAVRMYQRALELGIDQPEEVHLNIANISMDHLRDNEKARVEFERSLAIKPDYYGAYHNLGNLAEQLGDREEAAACFQRCLEIEPGNPSALARLADAHKFHRADDPLLATLVESADANDNSDLHFALGSAFNQLADYESAWSHFSTANTLDRKHLPPYSREKTEADFRHIALQSNREWLDQFKGKSHESVFICGMFRTGSTLLEQALACHPSFEAGGETEFFPRLVLREFYDYPRGLDEILPGEVQSWRVSHEQYSTRFTAGSTHLTDKRPDNFLYIGLIKAIVPSAKFIVTRRDWHDVALSIFSTRLGASQNYSTSLADIHHYIGQQDLLLEHWKSLLGDDLIEVHYEDLVQQPREIIGGVLDGLGEEWDERCLSFDQKVSTVKTASVWQVREPFHTRSIGRWKNHQRHFEETFDD
jgi:tetratricopeptide (TPR) repeat protein